MRGSRPRVATDVPPRCDHGGGAHGPARRGGHTNLSISRGGGPGGVVFNQFLLELTIRKDDFIRLFLGGGGGLGGSG